MFPSSNAHRRNHHQLNAVRLVVHLACGIGLYLIQEILFIGFRYGVFATSELHFTKIVRPVSPTFQQQVNLSPPSVFILDSCIFFLKISENEKYFLNFADF